jgi:signal transduction histidine kinase
VLLDDASANQSNSEDDYIRGKRPKSVLCLPIVKQTKVIGALYLENNLTARAFTSGRVAVLDVLASQAAISLENARLFSDLARSEALLSEAQHLSSTGSFLWRVSNDRITFSKQTYRIFGIDQNIPVSFDLAMSRVHPEDTPALLELLGRARTQGDDMDYEYRLLMPSRSVKYLHLVAHATQDQGGHIEYIGAIQDVTDRRVSGEALDKARSELVHVSRVASLGALTASIAHEVNQPLGAVVANANACLRWLDRQPPKLEEAKESVRQIVLDGVRGSEVLTGIRSLLRREQPRCVRLNANVIVEEIVVLLRFELSEVTTHTLLAENLPLVVADHVQVQQVLLNLITNALEAMKPVSDRPRVLRIETQRHDGHTVVVTVRDSGIGLKENQMQELFEPFYSTKPQGLGMGLSICRAIVERYGGCLWAEANEGPGATFKFSLPIAEGGMP